jgi:hypothetical protein
MVLTAGVNVRTALTRRLPKEGNAEAGDGNLERVPPCLGDRAAIEVERVERCEGGA